MDWKLADAKNRFSEVVNLALSKGPQRILRRRDVVIVLAKADFEKLIGKRPSFKKFLTQGPGFKNLDLSRDPSYMREVDL